MKKLIVILLPLFIILFFTSHDKTEIVMEKRYTTPEEEATLMHDISKDSFVVNKIPKPIEFKVKNSSTINFEVNTEVTDGHLCQPIIDVRDSIIYVTYKTLSDSSKTKVYDLIYPVTLVYQITDLKPREKNYKVLFTYPEK